MTVTLFATPKRNYLARFTHNNSSFYACCKNAKYFQDLCRSKMTDSIWPKSFEHDRNYDNDETYLLSLTESWDQSVCCKLYLLCIDCLSRSNCKVYVTFSCYLSCYLLLFILFIVCYTEVRRTPDKLIRWIIIFQNLIVAIFLLFASLILRIKLTQLFG